MTAEQIKRVRRFNRLVTQRVGALDDHYLGSNRPLGESRVLFEIGREGADLRDLRARLGLDSGYLSRLVRSLAARRLVTFRAGRDDRRVRRVALTRTGLAQLDEMNRRSDDLARTTLAPLSSTQRERLVRAMDQVHGLLRVAGATFERVVPASSEATWCLTQYFAELARRFDDGFDPQRSIPADAADYAPPHGAFLVARIDGEPVACGCIRTIAPRIAYLKRMWVADSLRGFGFGRRMLAALEDEAWSLGLTTVRLETNASLVEAIHLYETSGYARVEAFNDERYAHHWFEKRLTRARRSR